MMQMNEAALKHHGIMASRQLRWRIARTYDVDLLMKVCNLPASSTTCCTTSQHNERVCKAG